MTWLVAGIAAAFDASLLALVGAKLWRSRHRGASLRIPWAVAKAKKGWLEDRRPNANMDPYVVSRLLVETVCGDAAGN